MFNIELFNVKRSASRGIKQLYFTKIYRPCRTRSMLLNGLLFGKFVLMFLHYLYYLAWHSDGNSSNRGIKWVETYVVGKQSHQG